MGTEAAWVPYAVALLAAGGSAYNTKKTADDQDAVAARGIREQAARQKEADARVNEELGALEESNPDAERQKAMNDYLTQLRANRAQVEGGGRVPGASDEYQRDIATSKADIGNYGEKLSGVLSRIRGPLEQRRNEAYGRARTSSDIEGVARNAEGDDWLNRLRLSRVRRNPWIDAAAAAGMAYAGASAGAAGARGANVGAGSVGGTGAGGGSTSFLQSASRFA